MIHLSPCHRFTHPFYLYDCFCFHYKGIWGWFIMDDFGAAVESGEQMDEVSKFEGEH